MRPVLSQSKSLMQVTSLGQLEVFRAPKVVRFATPAVLAWTAVAPGAQAIRPQWKDYSRIGRTSGPSLRSLQWNDDSENSLEYFRPTSAGKSAALNFLCRLCGPRITGGNSKDGET